MMHSAPFFLIALGLYLLASTLYAWGLLRRTSHVERSALYLALGGLVLHTAGLAVLTLALRRAPFMTLFESLLCIGWAMMAIFLHTVWRNRAPALGFPLCGIAAILLAGGLITVPPAAVPLPAAFQSPWRDLHIGSTLVSYASFTLAFCAALSYLLQERLLKKKRLSPLQQHLPPLETLDRLAYRMVTAGFLLLTLGIITGSIWAQSAWGHYWNWDPKETWALVTWLVYASYLHVRIIQGLQGKWANRLLITGFISILITYLGVTFFAISQHSYR